MNLNNLKFSSKIDVGKGKEAIQDINAIMGLTTNTASSLQALIFPQNGLNEDRDPTTPQNVGITAEYNGKKEGFIFDLKEDYRLSLTSDITDHYVEDNRAIQDHIALRPITIEVSGRIAEVNLNTPYDEGENIDSAKKALNTLDSYYNRMGSLPQFSPKIINQARDIINSAKGVYDTYKTFSSFIKKYSGEQQQTRQSKIVSRFKQYWSERTKFVIVTPYCVLENMYILDFSANQPRNTKYVTEIKIKFKQVREAKVITVRNKFKTQGAEIAANKQRVLEEPTYIGQNAIPVPEEEYGYVAVPKQTLNVSKIREYITENSLSKSLSKILSTIGDKGANFSNISTVGMSASEVSNAQVLTNNMSLLPINNTTTFFNPMMGGF